MKRKLIYQLVIVIVFVLVLNTRPLVAKSPPKKGEVLPEINLPVPKDQGHRNYLGLSGEGFFKISRIKAEVVIIEIFSMY